MLNGDKDRNIIDNYEKLRLHERCNSQIKKLNDVDKIPIIISGNKLAKRFCCIVNDSFNGGVFPDTTIQERR